MPTAGPSPAQIIRGTTFEQYMRIEAERSSTLRSMMVSPLRYQYDSTRQRADTISTRLGRTVHTSVLEPDRFPLEYAVYQGPRRAGKDWEAFEEAHAAQTIIKADEYARAIAIRNAVRSNKLAAELLAEGDPEVTVLWEQWPTGTKCKARLDWINPSRGVLDLKTTRSIEPGAFAREVARYAYHVQFGMYADGYRQVNGGELPPFFAVVVESSAPYDVVVYRVPEGLIEHGIAEYGTLLAKVAECRASGKWPGVANDQELALTLPEWAMGDRADLNELVLEMGGESFAV